jgi:hypothetical protein
LDYIIDVGFYFKKKYIDVGSIFSNGNGDAGEF